MYILMYDIYVCMFNRKTAKENGIITRKLRRVELGRRFSKENEE